MYLLLISTLFINYLCISGGPLPGLSVFDKIQQSADNEELSCESLRASGFLKSPILTKCLYADIISTDPKRPGNDTDLCLLFYSAFMNLCHFSTALPQQAVRATLNEKLEETQVQIASVCGTIANETKSFVYDDVKDSAVLTLEKIDSPYCALLCLMPNWYIRHECILTSFMLRKYSDMMSVALKSKYFKPKHTEQGVQDNQDANAQTINKDSKTDIHPSPAQQSSNNDEIGATVPNKSDASSTVKPDTKADPPTKVNSVINQLVKVDPNLPKAEPENIDPLNDSKKTTLNVTQHQATDDKKENTASVVEGQHPMTNSENQNKANAISQDTTVGDKPAPNSQDANLEKSKTTKAPEQKKIEAKDPVIPDEVILDENKQTTQEKPATKLNSEVGKQDPKKTQFDNNFDKEENSPDVGGDDDFNTGLNEPDYPEDIRLDNSILPELPPGNPAEVVNEKPKSSEVKTKIEKKLSNKPQETNEDDEGLPANYQNQSIDDSDSYFFSYFMMVCIMFICGYVAYHNKQKILALVVEGRRGRRTSRTRRPNSANYRKLDSNLEEAVTSACNKNTTQIIY